MSMLLFFRSISGILDCNSNPCAFLLCTGAWRLCTNQGRCPNKWRSTPHFVHPPHFRFWTQDHTFWGHQCTLPRDRARPRAPSIAPHSWLPGRKSPPQRCCPGGSRWPCSFDWKMWRHRQRNPQRGQSLCFLDIIVWYFQNKTGFLEIFVQSWLKLHWYLVSIGYSIAIEISFHLILWTAGSCWAVLSCF